MSSNIICAGPNYTGVYTRNDFYTCGWDACNFFSKNFYGPRKSKKQLTHVKQIKFSQKEIKSIYALQYNMLFQNEERTYGIGYAYQRPSKIEPQEIFPVDCINQIAATQNYTIMLLKNDELWGYKFRKLKMAFPFIKINPVDKGPILQITSSAFHVAILTSQGVFTNISRDNMEPWKTKNLTKLNLGSIAPSEIRSIHLGHKFGFIVKNDGKVFAFGPDNSVGQMGLGHNIEIPSEQATIHEGEKVIIAPPKQIKIPGKVTSVHPGVFHTFINTTEGLYGFGYNEFGQLGTGDNKNKNVPTKIRLDNSSKAHVAVGMYHSVFFNNKGLYTCGHSGYGQLGTNDYKDKNSPTKIKDYSFVH